MATKKIEHTAGKGSAFTLDELEAFAADARRSGATGREIVAVRATWGAKIRHLSVDVTVPTTTPLDKA